MMRMANKYQWMLWVFLLIFVMSAAGEEFSYTIDASLHLRDSKVILWGGKEYFRFDMSEKKIDQGYPKVTQTVLEDFPFETVDACVGYGDGKAVFFKGDEFFKYDLRGNKPVSKGVEKINATTWPGLPFKKVDAGFSVEERMYLFSGNQFLIFDWDKKQVKSGFPKPINEANWPGLPITEVDSALNFMNKTIYFFKGDKYYAFDVKSKKANSGYPKSIKDNWSGVKFQIPGEEKTEVVEKPEEPDVGISFFRGSFKEAKAEALKTGKILWVDAYTVWCGPCKWMAENTFTDEKTAEYYNANFINYRLDMEKGEGINFAWDYSINAYPTIVYFNPKGVEIHRFVGAKDGEAFVAAGKRAYQLKDNGDTPEPEKEKDVTELVKGKPVGTEIIAPQKAFWEQEVLQLVNVERKKHKLGSLTWRDDLGNSARYHAADMGIEDYFNHDSYDRNSKELVFVCDTWQRILPFASSPGAENIAAGQASPASVMEAWMNSPGHRANILNGNLKYLGVGYYYWKDSAYGHYWVQNFGY